MCSLDKILLAFALLHFVLKAKLVCYSWYLLTSCFCLLFWFCPYNYTVEVRNRLKGLDLIDRVPDELWTEVRDIV